MTDPDLEQYCARAIEAEITAAMQIDPAGVVTAGWVRLKCRFGCPAYDRSYCCPPFTPAPAETRSIIDAYHRGLIFRIEAND